MTDLIERTDAATQTVVDSETDCRKAHFEYELEKLEMSTIKSRRIRGYTRGRFLGRLTRAVGVLFAVEQ